MSKFLSFLQKIPNNLLQANKPKTEEDLVPVFSSQENLPPETFFITPRIAIIPYPTQDYCSILAGYFNTHYGRKYMVWNLSEHQYETDIFGGQVLDFIYVGYPNPPLEVIFSICNSIKAWLDTDAENIALIHCQATKARSFMILACYLAWSSFDYQNPEQALAHICDFTKTERNNLLFPTQSRYLWYFDRILQGERPITHKIKLQRLIMNGIPIIEKQGSCVRPYIQIFKGSNMIYSSIKKDAPPLSFFETDMSISFDIDLEAEGDILIRCRHQTKDNKRITIFRVMFHTAFVSDIHIRFAKSDLDFANTHEGFGDDFMLDLFISGSEPVDIEQSQQLWKYIEKRKKHRRGLERKVDTEEEEEKVDHELIEKFKDKMEDSGEEEGEEEDDLDAYFQSLESKGK